MPYTHAEERRAYNRAWMRKRRQGTGTRQSVAWRRQVTVEISAWDAIAYHAWLAEADHAWSQPDVPDEAA